MSDNTKAIKSWADLHVSHLFILQRNPVFNTLSKGKSWHGRNQKYERLYQLHYHYYLFISDLKVNTRLVSVPVLLINTLFISP